METVSISKKENGFGLLWLLLAGSIIAVIFLMFYLAPRGGNSLSAPPSAEKSGVYDGVRKSDMQQIVSAMQAYYGENGVYPAYASYPDAVGAYLARTPRDPRTGGPYGWIDNSENGGRFCAYAALGTSPVTYYTASPEGTGVVNNPPASLEECK